MDPVLAGLASDLRAINQRVVVLGAQFVALKLKAAAFVREQAKLLDDLQAADVRASLE